MTTAPDHHHSDLTAELDEGEQLQWSGRPTVASYRRAYRPTMVTLLILAICFGLMFVTLGVVYSFAPSGSENDPVGMITFGCFIIAASIGGYLFWLRETRYIATHSIYAVTDRRVITLRRHRNGSLTEHDFMPDQIAHIVRTEYPDGTGSLTLDIAGVSRSTQHPHLTGIHDAREVERLIRKLHTDR